MEITMIIKSTNRDKVSIVTGSATGIDCGTALHLAKNGFRIYATMRIFREQMKSRLLLLAQVP
jgi:NAD(P)-dependent dehydrogenase (short-subunit alcohol dehydrogenase family)